MTGMPDLHAVREGKLALGGWELDCHHLNNDRRLIAQKSFAGVLEMKQRTSGPFTRRLSHLIDNPILRSRKMLALKQLIDNPISYRTMAGAKSLGYEATSLIEYCKAVLEARRTGYLIGDIALRYAMNCETFVIACAKVGIIALVDEATGYSEDKKKTEYRELFKEFIREEIRSWEKEYPDQFFDLIYRLYGLKRSKGNHPQFFGKFIRYHVYRPLAASNGAILEVLDEKNPVMYGGRKYKMHQFLTDHVGLPSLRSHLWQIIGIGKAARTRQSFNTAFKRAFPQTGDQEEFDFEE